MRTPLLLAGVFLLGGCAWAPGQGYAVVEPTVRVAYTPLAARDAGEGYQRLSSDYQVRLDSASLRLSSIELLASAAGSTGAGAAFDPARPPAGYTLCHGGHCHRTDGALIPYAQVAAELGGGGGASAVVTLTEDGPLDLLAPETRAMACAPECALPETQVSQGRWSVSTVRLTGTVRDARVPTRFSGERAFTVEFAPTTGSDTPVALLSSALDLASDRVTPPVAKLGLSLTLTPTLFDAVDWSALKADGTLSDKDRAALLERMAQLVPTAEISRASP